LSLNALFLAAAVLIPDASALDIWSSDYFLKLVEKLP
jgi:hypothetical protein